MKKYKLIKLTDKTWCIVDENTNLRSEFFSPDLMLKQNFGFSCHIPVKHLTEWAEQIDEIIILK